MKLSTLVDPQFQAALRKLASQDLPLKTAFKLKGIIKLCNEELAKYNEVRTETLQRLGNKKSDGSLDVDERGTVKLEEENLKQFTNELTALIEAEVSIGELKLEELGEKISLSAQELIALDGVVKS